MAEANSRLENDRTSLIMANSRILEEKLQLESGINHLQGENSQLKVDQDQLKAEKDQLLAENHQLKVENGNLSFSNQQLVSEMIQLKSLHQQEKSALQLEEEQLRRDPHNAKMSESELFKKSPVSGTGCSITISYNN